MRLKNVNISEEKSEIPQTNVLPDQFNFLKHFSK